LTVTPSQAELLLTGEHAYKQLAFNMLLNRLRERFTADSSPQSVAVCAEEINAFLNKFSTIMGEDLGYIIQILS
jgi:hypothetical protein